jgi:hypothetical protein
VSPTARKGGEKRRDPEAAPPTPVEEGPARMDREAERSRALAELYRPLREAAEATLSSTPGGAKALKALQALAAEADAVNGRVLSGEISVAEGSRATYDLRMRFRDRHADAWLDAHAANERLQPSLEAIARAIDPDSVRGRRVWDAEVRPFEAILLTPKAEPDDVGTIKQGLGDPAPTPPVGICLQPPYVRHETMENAQVFGLTAATAQGNGYLYAIATAGAAAGVGGGSTAEGFVGGDVSIPAGHQDFEAVADIDFSYNGYSWAVFGASGSGSEIVVRIDKGDGSAGQEDRRTLFWLVSPVAWGNSAAGSGNRRVVIPFRRATSSAGQVRIMVGASSHAGAWAFTAMAQASAQLTVTSICVNSTD